MIVVDIGSAPRGSLRYYSSGRGFPSWELPVWLALGMQGACSPHFQQALERALYYTLLFGGLTSAIPRHENRHSSQ
ncbi:hypothetical protein LMH87_010311 [Akanthomyces muscarius]|uniref:Uncharacterized protein n=1 Tax=Akanthomyces muscarius TaxID=2231603 RepID=A0A9W8QDI7_AKAMU|nr:hypothetical protein LMH87_010311 [Akanthomyces muscarius]KAJ4153841.1 hypothetical protein LMH87_010311 [Akanthomyces muscarius]